jgi:hypothetical protein
VATPDRLLRALEGRDLATGLMSPTQGSYYPEQALLDITQGTRVSPVGYEPSAPEPLRLGTPGAPNLIEGWPAAVRRARRAPGGIVPGRLASTIPGGVAFAGVRRGPTLDAVAAADRTGRVAEVSLGSPGSLPRRADRLLARHRLVVVQAAGPPQTVYRTLDTLLAARLPGDMAIVTQSPPDVRTLRFMPVALAGPGIAGGGLTSDTTRTPGVIAGIDLLPTILGHVGLTVAQGVTGQPIRVRERQPAADLEALRARYGHVAPRRVRTLEGLLAAWVLLTAALAAVGRRRGVAAGLRVGALAFMWVPTVVLAGGPLDPASPLAEVALTVGGAFALGVLTDLALRWPRGPIAPAAACLVAYTADLALGSGLIDVSLLGPNPRSGARFFGIGNELEPTLPILLFAGLAAAFAARPRSRAMALAFGGAGGALAVVVGSGYLGADVGGVITVSAGAAAATLAALAGGLTRRAVVLAACVPVVAVALLAGLDSLTGASTHFSRNVLEAQGGASLWEVAARRYQFALHTLLRGLMPLATLLAIGAVAAALWWRRRLYANLPGPAYSAALIGGLTAGVVGALANDSGPLLFVVAVFLLGLITAYLAGAPRPSAARVETSDGKAEPAAMQESAFPTGRMEGGRPPATVP